MAWSDPGLLAFRVRVHKIRETCGKMQTLSFSAADRERPNNNYPKNNVLQALIERGCGAGWRCAGTDSRIAGGKTRSGTQDASGASIREIAQSPEQGRSMAQKNIGIFNARACRIFWHPQRQHIRGALMFENC